MNERRTFYIPVSRGIFEHRKRIGAALWEFLYLLDRVTAEREEGGATVGLVANGSPLRLGDIATAVRCCERTVRRNLGHLVRSGYIRAEQAAGNASSYAVLNCKKFTAWGRTRVSGVGRTEMSGGADRSVLPPRTEMSETPDKSVLANKESNSINRKQYRRTAGSTTATTVELGDGKDTASSDQHALISALGEVWEHYLASTGRNGQTYRLTDTRRRKGMARLRECMGVAHGDLHKATELMKLAIDRLAASDWHMGRDPKTGGRRYCEWETNLFGTVEQLEKWWQQ